MIFKLLLQVPGLGVPNDGALVDRGREEVIPALVPLDRENGSLVLRERVPQLPLLRPDSRHPIIRPRRQKGPGTL